ncbi:sulfatase-like hydrolase/transferase [Halosimplex rubrum]|nr:sulfatase-like hydrolase/transferase [Halosimplex rubrum]
MRDVPELPIGSRRNVLVVTIDCLRNDRISRTGYERETTPFIDSLESYTSSIAAAPWTFSSVPSILTGRYPHEHGAVYSDDSSRNQDLNNPPNSVREDVHTLSELFAASGYETRFDTAITTAALPIRGRFKTMNIRNQATAGDLLSGMEEWWNSTSEAKFGYVQLGDLHEPLQRPEAVPFGDVPDIDGIERWRFEDGKVEHPDFAQYRDARVLLYDTLVRYIDGEIEQTLNNLNGIEDTIVVVTSDHGEEFWEYVEFEQEHFEDPRGTAGVGHGHALVPPVIEVPIATNIGNIDDSRRASTVDIAPTILHELGVDDEYSTTGVPLQRDQYSETVLSQEIAYGPNQISVTKEEDHLIYVPEREKSILIDFSTGEECSDPDRRDELLEYIPDEKVVGSEMDLSQDVQEQLSDLGYAE